MVRQGWRRVVRATRQQPLMAGLTWVAVVVLAGAWGRLLLAAWSGDLAGVPDSGVTRWMALGVIFGAFPILILGLMAGIATLGDRRPFPLGLCQNCGYDLRGIADRCPECGRPVGWTEDDDPDAGPENENR